MFRILFTAVTLITVGHVIAPTLGQEVNQNAARSVDDLRKLRDFHDATTWSKEVLAQRYEQVFVGLWDNLIHQPDKFSVLKAFEFDSIRIATNKNDTRMDWGIVSRLFDGGEQVLTRAEALKLLESFEGSGYRLVESEWHHSAFQPETKNSPATSTISILLHIEKKNQNLRLIGRGDLQIEWLQGDKPRVAKVDATGLRFLIRQGKPPFQVVNVLTFDVESSGAKPASIHPVTLRDLNHDGRIELIFGSFNRVYKNLGGWKFETNRLCDFPTPFCRATVFADFDGDGNDDYLCFPINKAPIMYKGTSGGKFPFPAVSVGIKDRMTKPSSVTVGDIDGDGDLDVFMGQQKSSYSSGFIPTPYYDANDGYPFYLLLNDGKGRFRDATAISGLAGKRNRHVFSSTFVDLDNDNDLDLLLTNDFCGCDYYINDGRGNFSDAREMLKPTPHGFGMSHSFGDYNLDGRLDFISIGMSSTTARRLEQMGLKRDGFSDYDSKRPQMGYGNRLFLNTPNGFMQSSFNDSCARTGWSWGSTTLDFDNDGDQDLYVANGQTSGKTTKDYCTRFWCHDVYYRSGERPDKAVGQLFKEMAPMFSGENISWNGYEHNALLMNQNGKGFSNVGFLMGVAFEFDARLVLSGDIDGDGRVDLLVEHKDIRNRQRHLYVLRNNWQSKNNWVGFLLRGNRKTTAHGAKVTATLSDGQQLIQHHLTGHAVWVQHPATIHFGTKDRSVDSVEVRWQDGTTTRSSNVALNKYQVVSPN